MKLQPSLAFVLLLLGSMGTASAAPAWLGLALAAKGTGSHLGPVSATPFDPSSLSRESEYFGRQKYSYKAVALELVLTAARLHSNEALLVYQRNLNAGYQVTTHWRLRASRRQVTVRYEIRF